MPFGPFLPVFCPFIQLSAFTRTPLAYHIQSRLSSTFLEYFAFPSYSPEPVPHAAPFFVPVRQALIEYHMSSRLSSTFFKIISSSRSLSLSAVPSVSPVELVYPTTRPPTLSSTFFRPLRFPNRSSESFLPDSPQALDYYIRPPHLCQLLF